MKKFFLVFNPYPAVGGSDTTLDRFLKIISTKNFEIYYFSLLNKKNKIKNIKYIILNSKSTFFGFFELRKFIKKKFINKKIIFFSMQYFVNVWTVFFFKKKKNIKLFLYEINHPTELDHFSNSFDYIKKRVIKILVKRYYKFAHVISGNSKELCKDLAHLVNTKVKLIYNPCFKKLSKNKKKYTRGNNIKILNIARLEKQKDHLTLLKAINISKYKKKIFLTIVGYGTYKNKILNFANKNNIKLFLFENETKLGRFYKLNDIFIMSSVYEGLPTVMIEAASYRLPMISSKFQSGSKEILGNGKFGFLYPVKNYIKLSKLIDIFYNDPSIFYKKEKYCSNSLSKYSIKKNQKIFFNSINKLI